MSSSTPNVLVAREYPVFIAIWVGTLTEEKADVLSTPFTIACAEVMFVMETHVTTQFVLGVT